MTTKPIHLVPCCIFIFVILLIIFGFEILMPLGDYYEYEKTECYITRVDYPTKIPLLNDTSNWIKCDCGKYCTSWYPCVKLYAEIKDDLYLKKNYYDSKNDACTFYERTCLDGENAQHLITYLNNAESLNEKYLNKNTTCFYDDSLKYIFLEKQIDYSALIFVSIFLGIILIYIFCALHYEYKCKCKKENKYEQNNKYVSSHNI